jgi:hypothetical protein
MSMHNCHLHLVQDGAKISSPNLALIHTLFQWARLNKIPMQSMSRHNTHWRGPNFLGHLGSRVWIFHLRLVPNTSPHCSHLDPSGSLQGSLMFLMHLGYRFFDLMSLNPILYIGASTIHVQSEQCNVCTTLIMHFQIHKTRSSCKSWDGWVQGYFQKFLNVA